MLSLVLALSLTAGPSPRLTYEAKCLYCHSAEMTESQRLTAAGWRKVIERMRVKAPLLISKSDVPLLVRFMTGTLKLVPVVKSDKPPEPVVVKHDDPRVPPPPLPPPEPELKKPPPETLPEEVEPAAPTEEQLALEQEASQLIARRCSKCHTLGRVYGKLDTLERSLTTLERMRFKTGSGITTHDLEVLEKYLRSQFNAD
ncbi:MAG: hypothetical protein U0228_14230 [Myxococcaceae bacterium]